MRQRLQIRLLSGCADETINDYFDPERRHRLREASVRRVADALERLGIQTGSEPTRAA